MRSIATILLMGVALLCAGCWSAAKPDSYATYVQLVKDQTAGAQAERDARMAAFAQMAQKCAGDGCIQAVAMTAAFGSGSGGQSQAPIIQPPAPEQHFGQQLLLTLLNGNLASTLVSGAVNWHQSDNNTKTQIGQYNFLSSAIGDMKSSISVNGNYVPGNYYAGGFIGGSANGAGAGIGNAYTYNRNTTVTGNGNGTNGSKVDNTDTNGTGNGVNGSNVDNSHDNRTTSPGPFDNSNNGGTGGNCSTGAGGSGTGAGTGTGTGGSTAPGGTCSGGPGG